MPFVGQSILRLAVADELEAAAWNSLCVQEIEDAGKRAEILSFGGPPRPLLKTLLLCQGTPSAPRMRCGIETVDEPGSLSDRCCDAEGKVLGELEGLEMVDDDRLPNVTAQLGQATREEEEAVTAEPSAQSRDGRGSTAKRACDLSMGGAGLEACGHGEKQLGALEVVGGGEGLAGEGVATSQAEKARDTSAARGAVAPLLAEAIPRPPQGVLGAVRSWAEEGMESLQALDGSIRPVHAVA